MREGNPWVIAGRKEGDDLKNLDPIWLRLRRSAACAFRSRQLGVQGAGDRRMPADDRAPAPHAGGDDRALCAAQDTVCESAMRASEASRPISWDCSGRFISPDRSDAAGVAEDQPGGIAKRAEPLPPSPAHPAAVALTPDIPSPHFSSIRFAFGGPRGLPLPGSVRAPGRGLIRNFDPIALSPGDRS